LDNTLLTSFLDQQRPNNYILLDAGLCVPSWERKTPRRRRRWNS